MRKRFEQQLGLGQLPIEATYIISCYTTIREFKILIHQPLPDTVPKIFPFQKRLLKRKEQVFIFLFHPEVPYDNNASEQAIRNVKVKQKIPGSFRSERGAEIFARLRSVVDTIIKKGGNPFESIRFTINVAACKKEFMARQK